MVRLRKKMQSERGASILLALLMLLVCMMVAASVLGAAASNAGKARSNRVEQQKYLTVSSAIQLVADEIQKAEYTGKYTVYEWTEPHTKPDGTTYDTYHFHIQQEQGEFTCGDLSDTTVTPSPNILPLRDELDEIFSSQFTGKGNGYSVKANVNKQAQTERILTVTLPSDLKGYPETGTGTYQIQEKVTVKVTLDHATHHIMLTAWLGDGASPTDGSDPMSAELVSKVQKTDADGNPVLTDGNPLVTVSPPAGATASALTSGSGSGTPETTATMTWQLHWIKKGAA